MIVPKVPTPRPSGIDPRCLCGQETARYDAASGRSYCWMCSLLHLEDGHRRTLPHVLVVDTRAYIDRDRAGGGVVCPDCGQEYHDHTRCPSAEWMTILCDGSVVKL